jgi:hypothetical protein
MAVTYELLETFTGTRTQSAPDPDDKTKILEETLTGIIDIRVKFTSDDDTPVSVERNVNVCFDNDGSYDATATAARITEVGLGVAKKLLTKAVM